MKPLHKLNTMERARLLHQLFPQEIPAMLTYIENLCTVIWEDETGNRANWKHPTVPFDRLQELAAGIQSWLTILPKIKRSSRLFARILFVGDRAVFMEYAMDLYITTQRHPNGNFSVLLKILFQ